MNTDRELELLRKIEALLEAVPLDNEAKRRALEIADERSYENVGLRAEVERLRAALELIAAGTADSLDRYLNTKELQQIARRTLEQKTPLSESYDVPLKGHCGQS